MEVVINYRTEIQFGNGKLNKEVACDKLKLVGGVYMQHSCEVHT